MPRHYLFCEVAALLFVVLTITHTLALQSLGGPVLETKDALFLSQGLTGHRAWVTLALSTLYLYLRLGGHDCSQVLAIACTLAWFMFLEDSLAMDNVLFMPELTTGKLTQFSRPVFLLVITYMAVESRNKRVFYR